MKWYLHSLLALFLPATLPPAGVSARETVVLNHPDFSFFHATAMDQPRTHLILLDGDRVLGESGPAILNAFVDTGSSGFVLSNLHVTGDYEEAPALGIGEEDFIGDYTNVGIGGEEIGRVSRPFTVRLHNDPFPTEGEVLSTDFDAYGEHRLWVRQAPGPGEMTEVDLGGGFMYSLVSPVNIVGMPVIEQRTMSMEWKPLPPELLGLLPEHALTLETKLLPDGHPEIPPTNVTLDLEMRDMTGEAPEGETLPTFGKNPLVKNVTVSHDPDRPGVTADWLFDTGAGSSFISFGWAQRIGLIPETYSDLESFSVDHEAEGGLFSSVGGIGPGSVRVPILAVNEIRVSAKEGFDIAWNNVRVLVFEHEELAELDLQGIFGMNLIGPAATIDSAMLQGLDIGSGDSTSLLLLMAMLSDITPTPVKSIVFDITGETTAELRLFSERVAAVTRPFSAWIALHFEDPTDETRAAPDADPDGDGIANLAEYAFGSDPLTPDHPRLPVAEIRETEEARFLALSYERIPSADDLEFVVETSTDLRTWTEAAFAPETVVNTGGRERVTLQATDPLDAGEKRFLRLRIKRTTGE